ncbi:MAG TPA: hypothetical protein VHK27_04975 [Gammaproteobacteria bacterium]|nr:hypothetical protein [Gammaproteobacteria bacterium]
MTTRSDERNEFLTDLFVTAMEHGGYGAFRVHEYEWDMEPEDIYAVISFGDECESCDDGVCTSHRVTLDTMARGLRVIRDAVTKDDVLYNRTYGMRLYLAEASRRELMLCDRTNGDDGDYDVVDALAVVECALFGRVVYA